MKPFNPDTPAARDAGLRHEIKQLKNRADLRWKYAEPIAPADVPDDYVSGDPFNSSLEGPWLNIGVDADGNHLLPASYRLHAGGLQFRLAVTGGEASPGSTILTVATGYPRPSKTFRQFAQIGADGSGIGVVTVNPDGTVVYIGEVIGATGADGSVGATGAAGADGATWRSGTGAPSSGLGVNGDFYFRTDTDDVYKKASGAYTIIANLQGSPGADSTVPGPTGPAGSAGPGGGISVDFTFSTTTTDSDPGNGNLRLSNSTQTATTTIRADLLDAHGTDITALLDNLDASSSAVKGYIRLYKTNDPTKWIEFTLSARATPTGYRNLTVAEVAASGTSPIFANGDGVTLAFTRTGDKGDTGTNGTDGKPGGAITIEYAFSTTTTDADPGNGNVRLSNATQNAATTIRADLLDDLGADWTNVLGTLADASNPVKGHIRLSKKSDPTAYLLFTVSAVASPSGYRNITVSNVGSSTTSPFANGDVLLMSFTRAGDQGTAGTTGAPGTSAKLFDTTLGADTASIDTTGTSLAGYDVLEIFIIARTTEALAVGTILVRLNGDSGATQYDLELITGSNATASAAAVNQSSWSFNVAAANTQAGSAGVVRITIPGYAQTTFHKQAECTSGVNDSSAANERSRAIAARWRSTAAITDIQVTPSSGNLKAGTRVLIYGR